MDYRQLITSKAQQYGIPADLALAVAGVESNYNPGAISPKGAIGLFQLMPGTAADLGVDPTNPEQNIDGGLRYLRQQYDRYGSWELALAAYNAGPGAVAKYGGIPPYRETQSYVSKIMGRLGWGTPDPAVGQTLLDPTYSVEDVEGGIPTYSTTVTEFLTQPVGDTGIPVWVVALALAGLAYIIVRDS